MLNQSLSEELKDELLDGDIPKGLNKFLEKIVVVHIQLQQWKKDRRDRPNTADTVSIPCPTFGPAIGPPVSHPSYSPAGVVPVTDFG